MASTIKKLTKKQLKEMVLREIEEQGGGQPYFPARSPRRRADVPDVHARRKQLINKLEGIKQDLFNLHLPDPDSVSFENDRESYKQATINADQSLKAINVILNELSEIVMTFDWRTSEPSRRATTWAAQSRTPNAREEANLAAHSSAPNFTGEDD